MPPHHLSGASGGRSDQDTQALSDTGSVVTLLRPDLADRRAGEPMEVACVHGDTRTYETCHVVVGPPRGLHREGRDRTQSPSAPTDWERPNLPHLPPVMERRARTQTGPTAADNRSNTPTEPGRPTPPQPRHLARETSPGETAPHHPAHQPTGMARPPAWNQPRPPTP